jgi:hypothetical protein
VKTPQKRQNGLTMISWLGILVIVGTAILVGLKLFPIFLEHHTVKSMLNALPKEPLIGEKTAAEIRKIVDHRLDMNSVYDLGRDEIKVKRSGKTTTVEIKYETRENIAGNVDVVVSFEHSVQLNQTN